VLREAENDAEASYLGNFRFVPDAVTRTWWKRTVRFASRLLRDDRATDSDAKRALQGLYKRGAIYRSNRTRWRSCELGAPGP